MLFLAELLDTFLPTAIRSRREYVLNALLIVLVTILAVGGVGQALGQALTDIAPWSFGAAACVTAGYGVAYPLMRGRLEDTPGRR